MEVYDLMQKQLTLFPVRIDNTVKVAVLGSRCLRNSCYTSELVHAWLDALYEYHGNNLEVWHGDVEGPCRFAHHWCLHHPQVTEHRIAPTYRGWHPVKRSAYICRNVHRALILHVTGFVTRGTAHEIGFCERYGVDTEIITVDAIHDALQEVS